MTHRDNNNRYNKNRNSNHSKKGKSKKSKSRIRYYKSQQKKEKQGLLNFLSAFDISMYMDRARKLDRRFIIHVGPTNSGKTYDAIQALKKARRGVYLGPLRLLALEMFDRLNAEGCFCELLTGEEFIRVPTAGLTSSTTELLDERETYDVAVIDEAQMICDSRRGGAWTKALFLVDAREVHLCLSGDAEELICEIVEGFGAPYEVIRHERLAPLEFKGKIGGMHQIEDGDAVIVFSRKAVLATAGELQVAGKKASVIYGALPPESRREEVRKFANGETTVVVSTDAIGMGISLPIKRIIFREINKFDGEDVRQLTGSEIRQIAGRAGRYGIYDRGEVLTMSGVRAVQHALESPGKKLRDITIPFPKESVDTGYAFDRMFNEWQSLPFVKGYAREDMSEAAYLYKKLGSKNARRFDRKLLYELVTCPVDIKNDKLVRYWLESCMRIADAAVPKMPSFNTDNLEGCELQYKALDVRHQILRRIGIEDPRMEEKQRLAKRINRLLLLDKKQYQKRCRICGKELPATYRYGICDECFDGINY